MLYLSPQFKVSLQSPAFERLQFTDAEREIACSLLGGVKRNEIALLNARDQGISENAATKAVGQLIKSMQDKVGFPKGREHNFARHLLADNLQDLIVEISAEKADLTTKLSDSERAVLDQVARGINNSKIKTDLSLNDSQLRRHFKAAEEKLAALSPEHAALIAVASDAFLNGKNEQWPNLRVVSTSGASKFEFAL